MFSCSLVAHIVTAAFPMHRWKTIVSLTHLAKRDREAPPIDNDGNLKPRLTWLLLDHPYWERLLRQLSKEDEEHGFALIEAAMMLGWFTVAVKTVQVDPFLPLRISIYR